MNINENTALGKKSGENTGLGWKQITQNIHMFDGR